MKITVFFQEFLQERREKRQAALRQELSFIETQIRVILTENNNLALINTRVARESAGHEDETRSARLSARSSVVSHNNNLLGQINRRKREVNRKLLQYALA